MMVINQFIILLLLLLLLLLSTSSTPFILPVFLVLFDDYLNELFDR